LAFSAVFITLGILELLGIIGNNKDWRLVFTYITMVGVAVFIFLTIFTLSNEKRRAKICILDRVMLMPAPVAVLFLDIMTLAKGVDATLELHCYIIGIVFLYFGACYIFQAIYHYYFPLPILYEEDEPEAKPAEEKPEGEVIDATEKTPVIEEKKEEPSNPDDNK